MQPAEMWRYEAIAQGSKVCRPEDWFRPGEYVACGIDEIHLAGRIVEVSGKHPPILKICLYQGRSFCSSIGENCESSCRKRVLTTADHGNVLNAKDIFRLLDNPEFLSQIYSQCGISDYQKVEELFNLIAKLEARQKQGRC